LSNEVALLTSAALLSTAVAGLYSKRVSVSLIMLFYSSIILGVIFTFYGGAFIGLLHVITFAGAVSVMLLTAVLMTGESDLSIGSGAGKTSLIGAALVVTTVASSLLFGGLPSNLGAQPTQSPTATLQFIWLYRPWDLLILLMVFASSMVVVANLFSKEGQ
jgi:NADH-quinone oxidoreductase subunit J